MTNERAEKGASASWQPKRSQGNVSGAGLDIDKIFELRLSWHLVRVSGIFCNQSNFREIPGFKHFNQQVDIHVM